jgi:hypothetical protein
MAVCTKFSWSEFIHFIFYFCWAKLNQRTLSSTPPPNKKKSETIASTARGGMITIHIFFNCVQIFFVRFFQTIFVVCFQSVFVVFRLFLYSTLLQLENFTRIQLYYFTIFTSFAQPQSKCLLLFLVKSYHLIPQSICGQQDP